MMTPSDDILDLLTAYALGTLEPTEFAQVSELLQARPELRAVLAELRAAADTLPYALPESTPPADLRQRTLDFATGKNTARSEKPTVVSRARGWIMSLGTLAAVAVVAAVVGWAQFFGANAAAGNMAREIATAQAQLNQLQAQISEASRVLASLRSEAGQAALLETNSGQTVFVAKLPQLAPDRVYQLWRINGNNAPLPAGLFTVNQEGYGQTDLGGNATALNGEIIAVTNEPAGGSAGPTTQPIISSTING